MHIDLNADLGESFGSWVKGNDEALLDIISSANIACGFHAGDPDVMAKTIKLAKNRGVGIGAHPGFDDLVGFGRRRLNLPIETIQNQIRYQIGAIEAMANAEGTTITHVKLHGALSNMCSENYELAKACYEAVMSVAKEVPIMALVKTKQQDAVESLKANWVGEIFADRSYNDDATLVDRSMPGAVISDPIAAGARVAEMITRSAIITHTDKEIKTKIDTVCLHGDTPNAVNIAKEIKDALEKSGITITRF
ncbi:5-oxoprolinase subunit PxpA [Paracoccaceae bacterium]|nr:5-oxoprolinase subunit PxpA [Paracoccaceae bacterium]MDB3861161.1 5-oxoprolinase subunit PxpA [Paracoccaceae bacterium]